ncbi:MAG TPA: hypothetical protein VFP37_12590 [Steroidobacteraceae bacterium]|nr:hypothetical protein [Steroidobacteraceae bacterium]
MTSRRRAIFAPNAVRLPCLALVVLALAACAALPNDAPVVEQLDEETGLTITRLGRPLELYRDFLRRDAPGKFTFLAPFETNQMGAREPYLWLAIPLEDPEASVTPAVSVDGVRLDLPAPGRAADAAGLRRSPYKVPMSWAATFYYRIDAQLVEKLGAARTLVVQVTEPTRTGPLSTEYSLQVGQDPRLREFAARLAD